MWNTDDTSIIQVQARALAPAALNVDRQVPGISCCSGVDIHHLFYTITIRRYEGGNMPFTNLSDLYGAIHETGINLIVNHIMTQRPSLFNYGTKMFEANNGKLCSPVNAHREVKKRKNPIITVQNPLPIIGAAGAVGLDYCFQIVEFKVDFHPGNQFTLPPELNPPLAAQNVGLKLRVCGAIVCPERNIQEHYGEVIAEQYGKLVSTRDIVATLTGDRAVQLSGDRLFELDTRAISTRDTIPLNGTPQCFCIDVYVTARMEVVGTFNNRKLSIKLEGLEIVDLAPTGLENSLECYLISVLRIGILPRLRIALETVTFEINKFISLSLSVGLTPTSGALPFNPAVENDQVKVYINLGI